MLGVLGVLDDAAHLVTMGFRSEGDVILLLDGLKSDAADAAAPTSKGLRARTPSALREFSSSEYARTIAGIVGGAPPQIDLAAESRLINILVAAAAERLLASAHDLSDGGLAVALAECCFTSTAGLSASVALHACEQAEPALFGERGARAVVSLSRNHLARVLALAAQYGVAAREIGTVARGPFSISLNERLLVGADVPLLAEAWSGAIERLVLGLHAPGQL